MTKLEAFIKTRGIKPAELALRSEYSRQHILRVRKGQMEPSRKCIKAITRACRLIARTEEIQATDLFDL